MERTISGFHHGLLPTLDELVLYGLTFAVTLMGLAILGLASGNSR